MSEKNLPNITLAKLQMFAGNIPKTEYNKHSKYYYRSAEGILKEMKGELKKAGCSIVITEKLASFPDIESVVNAHKSIITTKGRMFVESTATLYRDTEVIASANAFAEVGTTRTGMDNPQNTGTSGSYAKKYALQNLFAIADGADDPDSHAPEKTPPKKPQTKPEHTPPPEIEPLEITATDEKMIANWLKGASNLKKLSVIFGNLDPGVQLNKKVTGMFGVRKTELLTASLALKEAELKKMNDWASYPTGKPAKASEKSYLENEIANIKKRLEGRK